MTHKPVTCRSCGAPIYIGRIEKTDKLIPVNAAPSPDGNIQLIDRRGQIIAKVLAQDHAKSLRETAEILGTEANLRVAHFSVCPDAKTWRKP